MIAEGVPPEDTPRGKWLAKAKAWDDAPRICPYCAATVKQRKLTGHIKKFHGYCAALLPPLSDTERARIEKLTRQGCLSNGWRQARKGRITASRAAAVLHLTRADPYNVARSMMQVFITTNNYLYLF